MREGLRSWLHRTGPWTAVVAGNAVILTVFLRHMTAAAVAAVVLFPTGVMAQPPIDSAAWLLCRDAATVLGLAAVLAGLLGVAVSGPDYHGLTGFPWGAVVSYLSGAAVLRVVRTRPVRSAAPR